MSPPGPPKAGEEAREVAREEGREGEVMGWGISMSSGESSPLLFSGFSLLVSCGSL
jgi:hypothetical protein